MDKSLLRRTSQGEDEPRFAMLETVREYARECLAASGEEPAARQAHAAVFSALAEGSWADLGGADQVAWVARLDAERDNIRAALTWYDGAGDGVRGLRLAGALAPYWDVHGMPSEGLGWLTRALATAAPAPTVTRAEALAWAGLLARALGDHDRAVALTTEALMVARATGDPRAIADALHSLGQVEVSREEYDRAATHHEEALALYRGLGSGLWAFALLNLGVATAQRGEAGAAREMLEAGLAGHQAAGNAWGAGFALRALGDLDRAGGDLDRAAERFRACVAIWREHRFQRGIAYALVGLATVAGAEGRPARAARLLGAAEALREGFGLALWATERAARERTEAGARAALSEESFAAAWARGRALPLDAAIVEALADTEEGQ